MNFPKLPEPIYNLTFTELWDSQRISNLLHNKLTIYARLKCVGDLYKEYSSSGQFVQEVRTAGEEVGIQLDQILNELASDFHDKSGTSEGEIVIQRVNMFSDLPSGVGNVSFEILYRQQLISNKLYNLLSRDVKLTYIQDLGEKYMSVDELVNSVKGAGKGKKAELTNFVNAIKHDPTLYLNAVVNTQPITLPYNYENEKPLFDDVRSLFIDYLSELPKSTKKTTHLDVVAEKYFLTPGTTLEEIGLWIKKTTERVRQRKEDFVRSFADWLAFEKNQYLPGYIINKRLTGRINSLFTNIKKRYPTIVSEVELIHFLEQENIELLDRHMPMWNFLQEVFKIRKASQSQYYFIRERFYIIDEDFDKDFFFQVVKLTLDILKESVIPIGHFDLFKALVKKIKKKDSERLKTLKNKLFDQLEKVLIQLPEIQRIDKEGDVLYQIQFDSLTSQGNMAERVLYESGRALYINEIISEIQKRLMQVGVTRDFDEASLRNQMLNNISNIVHYGKNSLYSLSKPENSESKQGHSKIDLVKKSLVEAERPLNLSEIDTYINDYLSNIGATNDQDIKSTSAILSYLMKKKDGIVRLEGGVYILKSSKEKYSINIKIAPSRSPKGALLEKVKRILNDEPQKTMLRKKLSSKLKSEGYPRPSIQSVLNKESVFEKYDNNGQTFIRLAKENYESLKIPKQVLIRESIIKLLRVVPECRLPLIVIVNQLEKEFSLTKTQRPIVYKIITSCPELFFKNNDTVTLLQTKDV